MSVKTRVLASRIMVRLEQRREMAVSLGIYAAMTERTLKPKQGRQTEKNAP